MKAVEDEALLKIENAKRKELYENFKKNEERWV